jgi:quercetin dioxygenase-like cupin family protein
MQPTTAKVPDEITTGDVYSTILITGEEAPKVRMSRMHFSSNSRTAWHSHTGGEYLHVIEGKALVQERGGKIEVVRAGETVFTEPDTEHWHGASEDGSMTLLAIWGAPVGEDNDPETNWGDEVSDEEAS